MVLENSLEVVESDAEADNTFDNTERSNTAIHISLQGKQIRLLEIIIITSRKLLLSELWLLACSWKTKQDLQGSILENYLAKS